MKNFKSKFLLLFTGLILSLFIPTMLSVTNVAYAGTGEPAEGGAVGTTAVTITETPQTYTFDGTKKAFEIKGCNVLEAELQTTPFAITYSNAEGAVTDPTNAGTYTVTINRDADGDYQAYSKTIEGGLVISKKKINAPEAITTGFVYNGSVQTYNLATNSAYIIEGNTRTDAGTQKVTVTLLDTANTEWSDGTNTPREYTFTINKAVKEVPVFASVVYNGKNQTATLPAGVDYCTIVTNNGGTDVGTYDVTLEMDGEIFNNYKWATTENATITTTFQITKATNKITEIVFADFEYKTKPTPATVKASFGASNAKFTIDGEETDFSEILLNAGKHTIVATIPGTTNYNEVTLSREFTINKAQVKASDLPTVSREYTYNGTEQTVVLANTKDYLTVSGTQTAKNADNYILTITINDSTNYEFAEGVQTTLTWTIKKGTNTFTDPLQISGWGYGENANTPTATGKWGEVTYSYKTKEGTALTAEQLKNASAGRYVVTAIIPADGNNYDEISSSEEFDITKKKVAPPTVKTGTFTYDGAVKTLELNGFDETIMNIAQNSGTNANSYTAIVTLKDTTNYEWTTAFDGNISWTINKATVEIPNEDTTVFTYTGTEQTYVVAQNEKYTVSNNIQTNAGKYNVTIALKDSTNYTWAGGSTENIVYQFEINKDTKELPQFNSVMYNGQKQTANPVEESDEYIIEINEGGTNVGVYNVTIKMSDELFANYKWATTDSQSVTTTFEITKANDNTLTNLSISGWTYGGEPSTPTATEKYGTATFTYVGINSTNYEESAIAPTNAGSYKLIAKVAETENYNGVEQSTEFAINKAANKFNSLTIEGWSAGSPAKTPQYNVDFGTPTFMYVSTDGKGYESDVAPTTVGRYKIVATVAETTNYDGATSETEFSVAGAPNAITGLTLAGWIYGEEANTPTATAQHGTIVYYYVQKGESAYTEENLTAPTNAGEYTVIAVVTGTEEYEGATASVDFTISKAEVDASKLPTVIGTYTYTGEKQTLVTTAVESYITLQGETEATNAGEYTVRAILDNNHKWAEGVRDTIVWTINKATPTITNLAITGWVYGGYDATVNTPTANSDFGIIRYEYKLDGVVVGNIANAGANTYTLVAIVDADTAGNYTEAQESITFTISKAVVSVVPSVKDAFTYTGSEQTLTAENLQDFNADIMTISDNTATNAGTTNVTIKLDANHIWETTNSDTTTIEWTINKAQITIENLAIAGFTYKEWNESTNVPSATTQFGATISYKYLDAENQEVADISTASAGSYKLIATVEDTTNYIGSTAEVNFVVAKKVVSTKPTAESVVFNGAEQIATLTGFDAEYMTIINGSNKGTSAGQYTILIELDPNYEWAENVDGKVLWTIEQKTITETPTLSQVTFVYDGNIKSVTVVGLPEGVVQECTNNMNVKAGSYNVTITLKGDYKWPEGVSHTLTWTITKAEDNTITNLEITGWTFGESAKTPTATAKYGVVTFTYVGTNGTTYAESATVPTGAGSYKLIARVEDTEDYNSCTLSKNFEIAKATLVINEATQQVTEGETGAFTIESAENSGADIYYAPTGTENWTTVVPTVAGVYDVKVVILSTSANYNPIERKISQGFKVVKPVVSDKPAETKTDPTEKTLKIGVVIGLLAVGFIAIAFIVVLCVHHKNKKKADDFIEEQDKEFFDE